MYTFASVQHFLLYLYDLKFSKGISLEEAYTGHMESLQLGPPKIINPHELSSLMIGRPPMAIGYTNALKLGHDCDLAHVGVMMLFDKKGPVYCKTLDNDDIVTRFEIPEVDKLETYGLRSDIYATPRIRYGVGGPVIQSVGITFRAKPPVKNDPEELAKLLGYFPDTEIIPGGEDDGEV